MPKSSSLATSPVVTRTFADRGRVERLPALGPEHGRQVDNFLPAREGVAELARGGQRRRPGGEHAERGEGVRGDLEDARRIGQAVDVVEHDGGAGPQGPEEQLGILVTIWTTKCRL
jgi:hypothetical protein